jgi:hypothetical protein
MRVGRAAIAAVALASLTGCAGMDRSACMAVAIGTGAALGGVAGGLITSEVINHGDSGGSRNWEIAGGTGVGVATGGLVGALIAHAACEEDAPPPAPAVRTPPPPPPPPPPPTERRGG